MFLVSCSCQRTRQQQHSQDSSFLITWSIGMQLICLHLGDMRSRADITSDGLEGENFEADIDAVDDAELSDDEDSSSNELSTLRTILSVPPLDVPMHEALETVQQAYNSLHVEFKGLRKDYLTLSATVPACSRNRTLKKTSMLDAKITAEGKKYTLFYHFWVIPGVFLTTPQPDIDPCSPTHWASPKAKLNGSMAELYKCVSKDLHGSMEKYTAFDSLTVLQLTYMILLSFALQLALSGQTLCMLSRAALRDNPGLLRLLKKNGEGEYIWLAPILFARPDAMVADEFLKNPVLVQIVHVEMYGKKILSGKTKGQKARGQHCNVQCVTEGLITGATIMAHFLLTHNPEFTVTGVETKINYQVDYNFYLERLFKRTPWARSVIDYFNKEVFDVTSSSLAPAPDSPSITAQTRTWEDDLLDKLDAPSQVASMLTHLPATSAVIDVVSNYHASISVNQGQSASATVQVQLGINLLTLDNTVEPTVSVTRMSTNTPEPEVEATKRVTHHGGGSKASVAKPRGRGRAKR
ncbi:uncharacterized protein EDB91DRAFT_1081052 [Suillus paluster]|uniref:uncharacterized protein n=1 Tax=Suillus paluster TaxID=48578 RepID=UPI001B874ADA|nr:uncharacterized protein EDB91DRAFT_1081052 [Suillus paluster]KAG1743671.1 hypothetical protein EDB91DRAFT_1081052 [Suillus paluster]